MHLSTVCLFIVENFNNSENFNKFHAFFECNFWSPNVPNYTIDVELKTVPIDLKKGIVKKVDSLKSSWYRG